MGNLPSYKPSKPTVIAPWVNYLRRSVTLDGNASSTARLDGSESNSRLVLSSISLSRDTNIAHASPLASVQGFCRALLDDPLLGVAAFNYAPAWSELEDDFAVAVIALSMADIIYWG